MRTRKSKIGWLLLIAVLVSFLAPVFAAAEGPLPPIILPPVPIVPPPDGGG